MDLSSQLTLTTTDGERIIKRLANHWRHKMDIVVIDQQTIIPFSPVSTAKLWSDENHLFASLHTNEAEAFDKLKSVIVNHINRMAGKEFDAHWQDQ